MSSTLTALTEATTFATTDEGYAVVSGNSRSYTFATLAKLFGNGTLPLAVGTITTSQPLTFTQTWNAGAVTFTGIQANITNTSSASASMLMDLQVGGNSRFSATASAPIVSVKGATGGQPRIQVAIDGDTNARINFGLDSADAPNLALGPGGASSRDTFLYRGGSNTLSQRNGTTAQSFEVYRTFTDSSNYEKLRFLSSSGTLEIRAESGGTGTDDLNLLLTPAGIGIVVASSNVQIANTVATPAGGSTTVRLLFGTTSGFGIYIGSGAPTVSAAKGSLYLRSDGSTTNDRMYVNTSGSTTWTAVNTVA